MDDNQSGARFSADESRAADFTRGCYSVLLPDGRTQVVRYTADHESGYVAEVTYEGEAKPYVAPPKPAYPARY